MFNSKTKKINEILKKNYNNSELININDFLSILYNPKTFYIINSIDKIYSTDIDIQDNFFPVNGILGDEIENIINFINNNENINNPYNIEIESANSLIIDYRKKMIAHEMDIINSINKILFAIIHGINIYKFNYKKEDIDESLTFIIFYNTINDYININIHQMIESIMFNSEHSFNMDLAFSILLEYIVIEKELNNPENAKINKKYQKTQDEIDKIKKRLLKKEKLLNIEFNNLKQIKQNPYEQ